VEKCHNKCGEMLLIDKNINGKMKAPGNVHDAIIRIGLKEDFFEKGAEILITDFHKSVS